MERKKPWKHPIMQFVAINKVSLGAYFTVNQYFNCLPRYSSTNVSTLTAINDTSMSLACNTVTAIAGDDEMTVISIDTVFKPQYPISNWQKNSLDLFSMEGDITEYALNIHYNRFVNAVISNNILFTEACLLV